MSKKLGIFAVVLVLFGASQSFAATSISVLGAAAIQGSFGMRVSFSGGGDAYVQDNSPSAEKNYYVSFRMNDDGMTLPNFDAITILRASGAEDGSDLAFQVKVINTIPNVGGTDYAIHVIPRLDTGANGVRVATFVKPGPHQYTVEFHAATADGANDGIVKLYRDAILRKDRLDYNNDARGVGAVRFGASGVSAGVTGSLDLDDFISTRTAQF